MRIAFVSFSTVPFGPNDLLYYRAAEQLLARGHRVCVHLVDWGTSRAPEFDALAKEGADISLRPGYRQAKGKLARQWQRVAAHFHDMRKDWQAVAEWRPDLIALADAATYHMLSAGGFCDFLRQCGAPWVTLSQYNDENTSLTHTELERGRWVFGEALHCVFVSQRNLDVARRQLCLPLDHGVVLDNPPKLQQWNQVSYTQSEIATFATVARFECAVKGQALVLQALSEPAWRDRSWTLTLYGKGPDEAYLRDLIAFLGLNNRVSVAGHVDGIHRVWEKAQLLILASSGEGKPLAITEAMVCGRPAVVTDVGGNAELIQDGVTGFVAESATLASVRSTLERAWLARDQWQQMGQRAHEAACKRLDPPPGHQLADLLLRTTA